MKLLPTLLIVLAISPFWPLLVGVIGWTLPEHLMPLSILALVGLYIPVFILASPPVRPQEAGARRSIIAAACVAALLLPIVLMINAPRFLVVADSHPPAILIEPIYGTTCRVTGLNIQAVPDVTEEMMDGVITFTIQPQSFNLLERLFPVTRGVPGSLRDGNGNEVTFTNNGAGKLKVFDSAGGNAEIDWTRDEPVITASHPVARSSSALSPSPAALQIADIGLFLLFLNPLFVWTLMTRAFQRALVRRRVSVFGVSQIMQAVALSCGLSSLVLVNLVVAERNIGSLDMLLPGLWFIAIPLEAIGLLLMSLELVHVAFKKDLRDRWRGAPSPAGDPTPASDA